jgi:hypothetical protein
MLVLALLLAQMVPAPMPTDDAPSAFACTFASALAGAHCVYEAAAGPGTARDNGKLAAEAGLRACTGESRGDESLRKECEKAVADASLSRACGIARRLADEQGRLTEDAGDCVEALRAAVARTTRAAAIALDCCRCLSEARCKVPANQCRRELADLTPGAALQSCLSHACAETCAFSSQPAPEKPQKAPLEPGDKI